MPKHEIKLWIEHAISIGNTDVQMSVRSDGVPLGRVQISTGSIDWIPSPNKKSGFSLSWEEFADVMANHGHKRK